MQSMTGYGHCQLERDGRVMTVEVKSVNHRFLDTSYRLPRHLAFLDDAVRRGVSARLSRGMREGARPVSPATTYTLTSLISG